MNSGFAINRVAISGHGIEPALLSDWRSLRQSNPELASPYFCPEFTACVAKTRGDVEVAVVRVDGRIMCIFPFQRESPDAGVPVGHPLSDYHGLISAPDFKADLTAILKACGLRTWRYDHVPASQSAFSPFHSKMAYSPVIDVSGGGESYFSEIRARTNEGVIAFRKSRSLARDHGPIAFDYHVPDSRLLDLLISWKSDQYHRTGAPDRFTTPWFRQSVEQVFACQSMDFAGVLSVLRAGDTPVALHFGLRSGPIWHYWFPAYDPRFAKYSPGIILLLKMAEVSASMGVGVIDLGKGNSVRYKEAFKTGDVPLGGGCVEVPSLGYSWRRMKMRMHTLRRGFETRGRQGVGT